MNNNFFEANWNLLKPLILEKWSKLSEDDLKQIAGRFESFLTKLQQRYGFTREEAEEEIRSWRPNLGSEASSRISSGTPRWLPWVVIGLPLLFVLGYLGNHETTTQSTPVATEEIYIDQNSLDSDMLIVDTLRNSLISSDQFTANLDQVRVDVANGVVTIRGTVPSQEQKDLIGSIANKIPNVKQVTNLLEVKQ